MHSKGAWFDGRVIHSDLRVMTSDTPQQLTMAWGSAEDSKTYAGCPDVSLTIRSDEYFLVGASQPELFA